MAQDESAWRWVRRTERRYAAWLRKVANHVSSIIRWFEPGDPDLLPHMTHVLERYADTLDPWSRAVAARMVHEVSGRDQKAWFKASRAIGRSLRKEVYEAPIGHVAQRIINDQVELIRSLPLHEGARVQRLTLEAVVDGERYAKVVPEILRTNEVTRNRAILIARTETAKTQSAIVQARAEFVGADQYIWMTVKDADVRDAHKKLHGKVFNWTDPPVAEAGGQRHHPGEFPNCFPGDTLVAPIDGIVAIFRAVYRGPLVVLRVGETLLRVTPNHPILTPLGWVAAGQLKVGDHVIEAGPQGSDAAGEYDVDNRLPSFEEIFAARMADRGRCQKLSVDDFYGDRFEDHEVEVVRTKFDLPLDRHLSSFERLRDQVVSGADRWVSGAGVERLTAQVFEAHLSRLRYALSVLFGAFPSGNIPVYVGLGSQRDAIPHEELVEPAARDAIRPRERRLAFAGGVPTNDLGAIGVRQQNRGLITASTCHDYHGYVYTLETERGYYSVTPTSIVVKNCRCYAEPIIPPLA